MEMLTDVFYHVRGDGRRYRGSRRRVDDRNETADSGADEWATSVGAIGGFHSGSPDLSLRHDDEFADSILGEDGGGDPADIGR
jgi:hypothetical protein